MRVPMSANIVLLVVALILLGAQANAASTTSGPLVIQQKNVPVRITEPGSYVLASNLRVSDPAVNAIFVDTDNVTIDLNGFTIFGPERGPVGSGSAVNTSVKDNVVVKNGGVRGFYDPAAACIHLPGVNNRVENVRVQSCPQQAIFVGCASVIIDCQVSSSGSGINTDGTAQVVNNTFFDTGGYCIQTYGGRPNCTGGALVMSNTCNRSQPGGLGIRVVGPGHRIESNVITGVEIGIDLSESEGSFFAKNLLYGVSVPFVDAEDDVDGADVDPSLANIIVP